MRETLAELWQDTMFRVLLGLLAIILLIFGVAIYYEDQAMQEWKQWCSAQGGHVDEHLSSSTGTGVSPSDGKVVVVVTSDTTYYCVSDDGRLLGVR